MARRVEGRKGGRRDRFGSVDFAGFSILKTLVKHTLIFVGVLEFISKLAEWSKSAHDFREEYVKDPNDYILHIYLIWLLLAFGYEGVRWKLRHDLAQLRAERRNRKGGRR